MSWCVLEKLRVGAGSNAAHGTMSELGILVRVCRTGADREPAGGWGRGTGCGPVSERRRKRMGICQEFGGIDAQRDRLRLWRPWGHLSIITTRMLLFVCHQSKAAYRDERDPLHGYIVYSPAPTANAQSCKLVAADHWSHSCAPLNARYTH